MKLKKPQKKIVIKQNSKVNLNGKDVEIINIKKNGDMVVSSF